MCGRFVNYIKDLGEWESVFEDWSEIRDTGYNVSPTQNIPVSTANTLTHMRWGLIPHWSKEIPTKYATFNARAETITTKPTYRDAWKNSQRCLIPALGYYEWKQEGSHKQPYFVCRVDKKPIVFGGVWDEWNNNNETILSCSIITQESSGKLKDLHPRMPCMIQKDQVEDWLYEGALSALGIATYNEPFNMNYYPVDRKVNNAKSQSPTLITPIEH